MPSTQDSGHSTGLQALGWVTTDWVWGAVLRYQSGALIPTADSNNAFLTELEGAPSQNPAIGVAATRIKIWFPTSRCSW